jgi:hypothetical protein
MNESTTFDGYRGSRQRILADTALVFDLETTGNPDIGAALRTQEKLETVAEMDEEQLNLLAARESIPLGNAKKYDAVLKAVNNYYAKKEGQLALKPYGCTIAAIACQDVRGADEEAEAMRAGVEPEEGDEWGGMVWGVDDKSTETDVITAFLSYLGTFSAPPVLMGYNIRGGSGGWRKGFDIPILRSRCIVLGIQWPYWLPASLSQDRWHPQLWDLMDVFGEGSCDDWLRACGLPLKSASGADVENMAPEEMWQYCADDVAKERLLCGIVLPSQHAPYCDLL